MSKQVESDISITVLNLLDHILMNFITENRPRSDTGACNDLENLLVDFSMKLN